MELSVLLVEDNPDEMKQFLRDIPGVFKAKGIDARIDEKVTFEDAYKAIQSLHTRYDLIITDTYRGDARTSSDAAVMSMISEYRKGKFAPIVVYSSGTKPATLETSAFVNWADKGTANDIERAIHETLDIGLPQIARNLHDDIDRAAGSFLWEFLEKNWEKLKSDTGVQSEQLERIVRRRAALRISDIAPGSDAYQAIPNRFGLEYYVYPALDREHFNLGDIIRNKKSADDIRVVLTPHCHLYIDEHRKQPKVDFVLTVKTVTAQSVLGDVLQKTRESDEPTKTKRLRQWTRSPADTNKAPEGRHWYLPKFLEIPHLFCDLLRIESVAYGVLGSDFDKLATLTPPYAEALQECFSSFYGSVGIPDIDPKSIRDLF